MYSVIIAPHMIFQPSCSHLSANQLGKKRKILPLRICCATLVLETDIAETQKWENQDANRVMPLRNGAF
jgi:hypothetical protein